MAKYGRKGLLALLLVSGCGGKVVTVDATPVACSLPWYAKVDSILNIGDAQGHGPDPGSAEWRSAVEFKLGIKNEKGKPDIMSADWCDYISTQLDR